MRPVLAAALLSLPLFAGLPNEAAAQTAPECTSANSDGSYTVPFGWALKPSGLAAGTKFRLLFITSTTRDATATDIATYNTFVQTAAKAGHSAISDSCGNLFKVVGSTSVTDARDNTGTTGTGVRIHWLNGNKLADNYADFYDGSWDDYGKTNESGASSTDTLVATGSNSDGTKDANFPLGGSVVVTAGTPRTGTNPISDGPTGTTNQSFYGLSPVFEVGAGTPPPSIDSTTIDEGRTKVFTFTGISSSWVAPIQVSTTSGTATANVCAVIGALPGLDACNHSDHHHDRAAGTLKVRIQALRDIDGSEGDETFTLTLTDGNGSGSNTFSETLTVRDGTAVPSVNATFDETGRNADNDPVATYELEEATAGTVTVRGSLAAPATAPVTIPFEFVDLNTDYRDYRVLSNTATVGVGQTRFSVSFRVFADTVVEDNELFRITIPGNTSTHATLAAADVVIRDGSPTFDGQDGPDTDSIRYHGKEDSNGRYACFVKGGEDVVDVTPQGAVTVPGQGREVSPPPPKLEIDWDRDSYDVGDTARIRIRSLDADGNPHRSCTDLPFRFNVDQDPGRWAPGGRPGQGPQWRGVATVLSPGPGDRWVTLGRGATQAELSFKVQAAGTMTFQVAQWIRRGGLVFNPDSQNRTYTAIWPTPEDRGGNALTVGETAATEVTATATCSGGCSYMYFRTRPQDVYEDSTGTVDVTVAFSSPTTSPLTLGFAVDGTATPGVDYTIPGLSGKSGSINVPSGSSQVTIPVTIVDDNHEDNGETVFITLSDSGGYSAPVPFRLRIRNDDPLAAATLVSIQAGEGVTEGGSASFTLTADPAPAEALDVSVTVATDGDYGIAAGTQTVTIPTSGSATLTLATAGDGADEADGSVSVTVDAGDGYSVGTPSSGSVAIADDDAPGSETGTGTAHPAVDPALIAQIREWMAIPSVNAAARNERFTRVLAAFGVENHANPMTLAEAEGYVRRGWRGRWQPIVDALKAIEAYVAPPASGPEVTIAAGDGVTEGTSATFTLTADPAPSAALDVTVTVAASGDYGIAAGQRTVTIPTSGSYVLTLVTTGDDADEADGSVSVTVDAGTGYTVGTASSGTVAIADDDLPPPAISVAAKATSITEGGDAVFTVTADRAPAADLAVTLTVSEKAGSDFVAAAGEGEKTATILAGETEATLTVRTDDDAADEPDGSVTATVDAGDSYMVASSPANAASVAVADNDAAGRPTVSVDDATAREGETMQFAVRLSVPADGVVWVRLRTRESSPVSARAVRDFRGVSETVWFLPGRTVGRFGVRIHDDSHDDGGETFEVEVLSVSDALGIDDGVAVGTIENSDPMPAAYLARFGRTVAEQALEGIAGRMSASRTPGMQGTVAGQALTFDPAASGQGPAGATPGAAGTPGATPADRQAALAMAEIARGLGADASAPAGPGPAFPGSLSGAGGASPGSATDPFGVGFDRPQAQSRTMTARDALLGSSFSLTGQKDGAGGSLAFWGRASQGSFDGAERGDGTDIRLDGTVTTGMLGADYARGKWLIGLALTQSTSEGKYAAIGDNPCSETNAATPVRCDGAVRAGDGDVEASLTAAIPYAALRASERLKLWGAAGYGTGEVTLNTMEESYKADTSWTMAAAGVRGDLLEAPAEGSGAALALTSDALWARTSSDKTGELNATDSDVTRLRLGLEGSYRMALADGGSLTPKLEIGARHDGGDAETGFGVEVGGGIAWVDPTLGLSLDVSGRTLLAHENDDLKDRGFSASLGFDPAPATQRGPSLSLRQDFGGQAQGGLDALFVNDPLEDRAGSEAASRWAMEAAYGLPVFGDRFTGSPHVGFGLSTGARDYSLGWRLTPEAATAPDLSFGVRATRRESDTAEAEHTVGFELTARW